MEEPLTVARSGATTGMSSLSVDVVAHICDYLFVEEILRHECTCAAFKAAIEKIRFFCCLDNRLILAHPLVFLRFSGAHSMWIELTDDDDVTQFFAITCSSLRRWRKLRIDFEMELGKELTPHLINLAAAIRAGLLSELQHLELISPWWADLDADGNAALLRVCSALPARAAVRLMIEVGFGKEAILQRIDASPSLDLNETSPYLDPVAVTITSSIAFDSAETEYLAEFSKLLHELEERGLDLNCRGSQSHLSALSLIIGQSDHEAFLKKAETMLALGADPNGGSPSPLLILCGAQAHFHLSPGVARLRRAPCGGRSSERRRSRHATYASSTSCYGAARTLSRRMTARRPWIISSRCCAK